MAVESRPYDNLNLSFVFENHGTSVSTSQDLALDQRTRMQEAFVPGEANVLLIERAFDWGPRESGVLYPRNPVIYHIRYGVDAVPGNEMVEARYRVNKLLRRNPGAGLKSSTHYFITMLGELENLNKQGMSIGIMYEDSILRRESRDNSNNLFGKEKQSLMEFKRMMDSFHSDYVFKRDMEVIEQVKKLSQDNHGSNVNVLAFRGTGHAGLTDLLPPDLRERVSFASCDFALMQEGWFREVQRIYMQDRKPTASEWEGIYAKYVAKKDS